MQCNLIRIRPGNTPVTSRSGDLIPVKVWGTNPTIEGMEMTPGSTTHIRKGVSIRVEEDSVVDLLVLVEKKK
jgi:hypothetical protein